MGRRVEVQQDEPENDEWETSMGYLYQGLKDGQFGVQGAIAVSNNLPGDISITDIHRVAQQIHYERSRNGRNQQE